MTDVDAIWNRARSDLTVATEQGDPDLFLWEHCARITRSSRQIASIAGVAELDPDITALTAAALYHEAAWVNRVREHGLSRFEILLRPIDEDHREQSAEMMERCLAGLLPTDSLQRAGTAIRALNHRPQRSADKSNGEPLEAKIISDARNLDEFSMVALWAMIRRGMLEGTAVQAVIDRWHRRMEYHFWSARLSDSFRFQAVRTLAKKRLDGFERLMKDLEAQQNASDIAEPPT